MNVKSIQKNILLAAIGFILLLSIFKIYFEDSNTLYWYDFDQHSYMFIEYWGDRPVEGYQYRNAKNVEWVYDQLMHSEPYRGEPISVSEWSCFIIIQIYAGKKDVIIELNSDGIAKTGDNNYLSVSDDVWKFLKFLRTQKTVLLIYD